MGSQRGKDNDHGIATKKKSFVLFFSSTSTCLSNSCSNVGYLSSLMKGLLRLVVKVRILAPWLSMNLSSSSLSKINKCYLTLFLQLFYGNKLQHHEIVRVKNNLKCKIKFVFERCGSQFEHNLFCFSTE